MSLVKEAANQQRELQEVNRVLRSNQPIPVDKGVLDQTIVKLLRTRLRYPDNSPVVIYGRRILKEMGR